MWVIDIDGHTMTEADMTAGEEELVYTLAVQGGVPHAWPELHPAHCPCCANAHLVGCLISRSPLGSVESGIRVAMMPRGERLACISRADEEGT